MHRPMEDKEQVRKLGPKQTWKSELAQAKLRLACVYFSLLVVTRDLL